MKRKRLEFGVQSWLIEAYLDLWHVYKSLTNVNNGIVGYVKGGKPGEGRVWGGDVGRRRA